MNYNLNLFWLSMRKFQPILFYRMLYYRPPWHTGRLVSTRVKFYRPFVCARASVYPACVCARVFVYLACVCARLSAWVLGACVTVCVCVYGCPWTNLSHFMYQQTPVVSELRAAGGETTAIGQWEARMEWKPMGATNDTLGSLWKPPKFHISLGKMLKNIIPIKFFKFTIFKD